MRLEELFEAARGLPPTDREEFLSRECDGDERLQAEIGRLLEWDLPTATLPGVDSPLPRSLGRYRLLEVLGHGGSSVVYLAEPVDGYRRRVAVKVLRGGLVGGDAAHRLLTERQILAALEHPNIARLYDGGATEGGLPYLVMEHVEGARVDEYCESAGLGLEARIDLFSRICEAVHYAHQNLVVHRDLKPGNILVTARGEPKLLDFGIAKLLNPDLSPAGGRPTAAWIRLLTPEYASPEQILGEPITTASDVYSLGVLLFRLLSGELPYETPAVRLAALEERGAESPPPRPSEAARRAPAARLPAASSRAALSRQLSGDLDRIVGRAMRREARRRYPSAQQLAADLRRYRAGRPVLARGDSWRYRLGKFLRRHRLLTAAAATAVLAMGLLLGLLTVQSVRLEEQRAQAALERDRAVQVSQWVIDLFDQANPSRARGRTLTVEEAMDRGAADLMASDDLPAEIRGSLLRTVGGIYLDLGHGDRAMPLLAQSVEVWRALDADAAELALSLRALGAALRDRGDHDAAEPLLREALALQLQRFEAGHPEVASSRDALARLLHYSDRLAEAERVHLQALAERRESLGQRHPRSLESENNLAAVVLALGRLDEAEQRYRRVTELQREVLGADHPNFIGSLNNLAEVAYRRGDQATAERLLEEVIERRERVFGPDHPLVAQALNNLGNILRRNGDSAAAEELHRRALAVWTSAHGEAHPDVGVGLNNLAVTLRSRGRFDEAERLHRRAHRLLAEQLGERHSLSASSRLGLGRTLLARGDPAAAEGPLRDSVRVYRAVLPEGNVWIARSEAALAACLRELGRTDEAAALAERSRSVLEAFGEPEARQVSLRHGR